MNFSSTEMLYGRPQDVVSGKENNVAIVRPSDILKRHLWSETSKRRHIQYIHVKFRCRKGSYFASIGQEGECSSISMSINTFVIIHRISPPNCTYHWPHSYMEIIQIDHMDSKNDGHIECEPTKIFALYRNVFDTAVQGTMNCSASYVTRKRSSHPTETRVGIEFQRSPVSTLR